MDKLLEDLIYLPGISGQEERIRDRIKQEIEGLAEIEIDNMGNMLVHIGEGEKNLLVTAHMDEIGLAVTYVEPNGYLRVRKVGGVDPRTVEGQPMRLITKTKEIPVAVAIKPPHLMLDKSEMKQGTSFEEMYIDVGAETPEEVSEMGIELFDYIVACKKLEYVNDNFVMGRSLDDRIGCWVMVKLLQELAKTPQPLRITFAWTVQEEIGLRGAEMLSRKLQPDYVIALDTISSGDTPIVAPHLATAACNKGPALRMLDSRCIASMWFSRFLEKLAKANDIPIQYAVSGGSTDGAAFQMTGAHMVAVTFPLRYTHAPCEMVRKSDVMHTLNLLKKVPQALALES